MYYSVIDQIGYGYKLFDIGSMVTILPSNYIGGPWYIKVRKQDALAVIQKFGKPIFFITFICNPTWQEFEE